MSRPCMVSVTADLGGIGFAFFPVESGPAFVDVFCLR